MTAEADPAQAAADGCPECGQALAGPFRRGRIFCSAACKQAWHNRWTTRGRVSAVLETAAWITRRGSRGDTVTGRAAMLANNRLKQQWINEDRAAGRMPADYYVRVRMKHGFDLPF